MAINTDSVGTEIDPVIRDYTWKDAVLYALGVGAGFQDLEYCHEKRLKMLPTFAMAMVFDMFFLAAKKAGVSLEGILHGEQELSFDRPIPSGGRLTTYGKIINIFDQGKEKGAIVEVETETHHSEGVRLFKGIMRIFARSDGGFGGRKAPKNPLIFPEREPDAVADAFPSDNQPLIYRLSGDYFDLHADPDFARQSGFQKPLMHGLCTLGFSCRALIQALIPGQPEKVRRIACRFSKPLYPGVPIRTAIWKTGSGKAVWKTMNTQNEETIIDKGVFEYEETLSKRIRFDKRTAIVTGAGSGLGRIYAIELAKRGARVVVNDPGVARDGSGSTDAGPADKVVEEIRAFGGVATADYHSVATPEGGENIVKTAVNAFGTADILINNAGILRDKSLSKMTPDMWNAVIGVHLNGAYYVTAPAFRLMKEKNFGRIVLTASAAGLYGNFGQSNYSAAKMGLIGLMNTIRLEGMKSNIVINTVAPVAATRLTEDVLPPDFLKLMKPELAAPMVLYLCSDECSQNGMIFNAGMGFFSRAAIVTGPSVRLGTPEAVPTPETVRDHISELMSLENSQEIPDTGSAILALISGK